MLGRLSPVYLACSTPLYRSSPVAPLFHGQYIACSGRYIKGNLRIYTNGWASSGSGPGTALAQRQARRIGPRPSPPRPSSTAHDLDPPPHDKLAPHPSSAAGGRRCHHALAPTWLSASTPSSEETLPRTPAHPAGDGQKRRRGGPPWPSMRSPHPLAPRGSLQDEASGRAPQDQHRATRAGPPRGPSPDGDAARTSPQRARRQPTSRARGHARGRARRHRGKAPRRGAGHGRTAQRARRDTTGRPGRTSPSRTNTRGSSRRPKDQRDGAAG